MTSLVILLGLVLVLSFGLVLLFGAPYLPTLRGELDDAFALLDLPKGGTLLELGCGDGRILLEAARRGYRAIGFELNPVLYVLCWLRTRRYRRHVEVRFGNFWIQPWPPADAIFVFLLQRYMTKLDKKIMQSARKPVKLVSVAFTIPGKRPSASRRAVTCYEYR